jgi:hypothetical protein
MELGQGGGGLERWEEGMSGWPFIGLERELGGRVMEGNGRWRWCAMMVVEAAVSGGDRPGRWWGVVRGGVLRPFQEHKRGGGRWCVRVHARRRWRRQQFGQGRKTIGRGLRVGERGRGELARPGKGRGPVAGGGGITMGGERGVGRPRWKERRAAAGPNPEPGQNSKINSFRISIDFRIWQNFGKLYNEIYEEF